MLYRRVGRRGAVLLIIAAIWNLFGLAIATFRPEPGTSGRFQLTVLDSPGWAALWITCGVIAAGCAFGRRWGWDDTPGWVAGVLPPMAWSAMYALSWIWWLGSHGEVGVARGWVGLVTWAFAVGLLQVIAGWEDDFVASRTDGDS